MVGGDMLSVFLQAKVGLGIGMSAIPSTCTRSFKSSVYTYLLMHTSTHKYKVTTVANRLCT